MAGKRTSVKMVNVGNRAVSATDLVNFCKTPLERDFATLVAKMLEDKDFKDSFWTDPVEAVHRAGLRVDIRAVDLLQKSNKDVFDRMLANAQGIMERGSSIGFGEKDVQIVTLLAALAVGLAVGALASEVAHHHFSISSDIPTRNS